MLIAPDENQAIQDLIWSVSSPPLMALSQNVTALPSKSDLMQWLTAQNPGPQLSAFIAQDPHHRLGHYFETLWSYFLTYHPDFELISTHLPVNKDKRTLGEFDFIYACLRTRKTVHLETAVKFYLGHPDKQGRALQWQQWIGPGRKDRLDIKLERLLHKQSQLSLSKEGADQLKGLGVTAPERKICLKGYFFYPYHLACSTPNQSLDQHLRGYWLPLRLIDHLPKEGTWCLLSKSQWLTGYQPTNEGAVVSHPQLTDSLTQYFSAHDFPLMLSHTTDKDTGDRAEQRFFVTSDGWP